MRSGRNRRGRKERRVMAVSALSAVPSWKKPSAICHQPLAMASDRTLWIVSGGAEAVPGIHRARAMGLHVVVSDANPSAPGFAAADEAVRASTYDVDATIAAATKYHKTVRAIDGVMCMAAD